MSHTTQPSFEQEDGSMSSVLLKAASLLLFIVIGAYSNGRVIHTVLLGDVHRPILNYFVASLSIADLASCLIVMPFIFVSLVFGEWIFGSFCNIHTMLSTYFANVAFLSVGATMYERYWAIYRRRFPSLSKRQVTALLVFIWIFPIPLTAPMLRERFTYAEFAGLCFINTTEHWTAAGITKFLVNAVGVLIIMFSFWKILTFLLSLRRRVSPGPVSNEEKLTTAAFVHSAWTLIVFVVIYLALNAPIVIVLVVNMQRRNAGKDPIPESLTGVFLWMYWLQCATKPIIYLLRSPRCMNFQCRRFHVEVTNEGTSRSSRPRSQVYEVREGQPSPLRTSNVFLDLWQISTELLPVTNAARRVDQDQTAGEGMTKAALSVPSHGERVAEGLPNDARNVVDQGETAGEGVSNDARSVPEKGRTSVESAGKQMQDNPVGTENAVDHSFILIEDLETNIHESEHEANSR